MILPQPRTLKKYGLTEQDYIEIYNLQNGLCPICENPLSNRVNIDHDHVRHWKKMSDENRKKHIRGILCFFCNKYYLGRSITIKKARNVVSYLERFERRLQEEL